MFYVYIVIWAGLPEIQTSIIVLEISVNDIEISIIIRNWIRYISIIQHGYLNSSTTSRVIGKIGRTAPIPQ